MQNTKSEDDEAEASVRKYFKKMCAGVEDILDLNCSKRLCYRIYDKEFGKYRDDIYYESDYDNSGYCKDLTKLKQLQVNIRFFSKENGKELKSERIKKLEKQVLEVYRLGVHIESVCIRYNHVKANLNKARTNFMNRFVVEHSIGQTTYDNQLIFYGDLVYRHHDRHGYRIVKENLPDICVSRENFELLEDLYHNYMFFAVIGNIHNEIKGSYTLGCPESDWIYRN